MKPLESPACRADGQGPEPVAEEALATWKERVASSGLGSGTSLSPGEPWQLVLERMMMDIGAPRDLRTHRDDEVNALHRVARAACVERCVVLPRRIRALWLGMLAARRRALAARGSWTADAKACWRKLQMLVDHGPPGALRRHTAHPKPGRRPAPGAAAVDDAASESPLELPVLRALGRAVVIVGGDARPEKLRRIRERPGLEVPWCACEQGERVAGRVRDGHVAGVILLHGLMGHARLSTLMEAARRYGVPLEYAYKGGLRALIEALRAIDRASTRML
jgi:hypothetical protein